MLRAIVLVWYLQNTKEIQAREYIQSVTTFTPKRISSTWGWPCSYNYSLGMARQLQVHPAEPSSTMHTFHWGATFILECLLWKQFFFSGESKGNKENNIRSWAILQSKSLWLSRPAGRNTPVTVRTLHLKHLNSEGPEYQQFVVSIYGPKKTLNTLNAHFPKHRDPTSCAMLSVLTLT